jgi:hypothetical protein
MWWLFGLKPALPGGLHAALQRIRGRRTPAYLAADAARLFSDTDSSLDWKHNRRGPLWWAFKAFLLTQGREKTYLAEYVRHRAAVAGIEARPPFMDLDLVKFALSYPPELDFDNRYDRPNVRGALRGRVPDALRLDRRKSSLAPFYHEGWIGPDLPVVRQLLLGPDCEVRRFVQPRIIDDLLNEPPAAGARRWMSFGARVWGLFSVECFLRHCRNPAFGDSLRAGPTLVPPSARLVRAPLAHLN